MKFIKKLLMWLGGLFALLIAFIVFMFSSSNDFQERHEPFIAQFMTDMAAEWQLADVYSRLSNEFIEQASTPQATHAMRQFATLGELQSIYDLQIGNYYSGTEGKTGEFTFKASFSNGEALVKMTLIERDETVKVQSVNITPAAPMLKTGNDRTST